MTFNKLSVKKETLLIKQVFNRASWSEELYTATRDHKYTGKQVNTQHWYVTMCVYHVCVSSWYCITYWVQYLSEKQKWPWGFWALRRFSFSGCTLKTVLQLAAYLWSFIHLVWVLLNTPSQREEQRKKGKTKGSKESREGNRRWK